MEAYLEKTKSWIEKMVIGLNLCPFAKVPFQQDTIRYAVILSAEETDLVAGLLNEMEVLVNTPPHEVETTLILFPNQLANFMDYLDFLDFANHLLVEAGLEGILQIASFHPDYQFAATAREAPENYSNRSPFPMLHLLREDSVERALESYPNPEKIPLENIRRLRALGIAGIQQLIKQV